MAAYTQKPVTVQALQFAGDNLADVSTFCGVMPWWLTKDGLKLADPKIGPTAHIGDWLVIDPNGQLFVVPAETFTANYAPTGS